LENLEVFGENKNTSISHLNFLKGAPMKPAARLHIIRQREYRKVCAGKPSRQGLKSLNYFIFDANLQL
jgi:hypothetical protein